VVDALSRQEHNILAISSATPAWIHDIEESYLQDTTFTTIIEQLLVNDQAIPDYSVHAGILRYKEKICIGASTDLRTKILSSLYSSAFGGGGHYGINATYNRVKIIFHWPQLKKSVEIFVVECPVCQRAKTENCQYPGLLAPLPIPNMAWTFISMDFIEGLPKSGNRNVILVVVD
jgi:hypothetical protein